MIQNRCYQKSIVITFSALLTIFFSSNSYGVTWENTFGGSADDRGNSVQQTTDGGFIIAGYTESFGAGGSDVYLIKTDGSGNLVWENTFGGTAGDEGRSVQQTTDGGFIIAGSTESFGAGGRDVYLIKTDASGNLVWEKIFGGSYNDDGNSVQQTTDGGFIIAGSTSGDVYLIKTDASGNLVWEKTFGGTDFDEGRSVQQTTDGGFIISGDTTYLIWGSVYLIKTDASGNLVWENTFGSGHGYSVRQTTDGGFIIAAGRRIYMKTYFYWAYLIKTDGSGNLVWENTFGEYPWPGIGGGYGYSGQQTTDGGFIIAGWEDPAFEFKSHEVSLIKTDASGNLVWGKTFGGTDFDEGRSVQQTTDGGYIIAGETSSFGAGSQDVYLIYTDEDGAGTQVQMQVASSSVAEEVGGSTHRVTVQLNTTGTLASAVTVDVVDLLTGSATEGAGNDYTYTTPTSVTFPIGSVDGATRTVALNILDDDRPEGDETINLQLQNVTSPATILPGGESHQVTITVNDMWETVYNTLFDSPSDLELFRQYRDEILSNTTKGVIYKTLLYTFSKQALHVLLSNPKFMYQAKVLIEPNYGAVLNVLGGYKGIINNTDEIAAFLDAYAKKSPLILKIFSYMVRWDILRKQIQGDLFFGFRLK
jgi:hypothetical protein